jgi:hypothetical protein
MSNVSGGAKDGDGLIEIIVEPNVRRRCGRRPLSAKKKAAALFRVWHGVRELIGEAEHWATADGAFPRGGPAPGQARHDRLGVAAFEHVDTSLPTGSPNRMIGRGPIVPGVERVAQAVAQRLNDNRRRSQSPARRPSTAPGR